MSINVLSKFHDYHKRMKCFVNTLAFDLKHIFYVYFKVPTKCNKSFIVKIPEFTYQFVKTNKKELNSREKKTNANVCATKNLIATHRLTDVQWNFIKGSYILRSLNAIAVDRQFTISAL